MMALKKIFLSLFFVLSMLNGYAVMENPKSWYENFYRQTINKKLHHNQLKNILQPLSHAAFQKHDIDAQITYFLITANDIWQWKDQQNKQTELYLEKAANLAKTSSNKLAMETLVALNYAQYFYHFNDFESSMPFVLKLTYNLEELNPENVIMPATTFKFLGNYYETLNEYEESFQFMKKALKYVEQKSNLEADILSGLGFCSLNMTDTIAALNYFEKSLQLARSNNYPLRMAKTYGEIGRIHSLRGNYELAERYFDKDLAISLQANEVKNLIYIRLLRGENEVKMKSFDKVESEVREIEQLLLSKPYLSDFIISLQKLKLKLYLQNGDTQKELLARRTLAFYQDSLKTGENSMILNNTRLQSIKEKYMRESNISKLLVEQKIFQNRMYLIILLLIVGLGIVIVISYNRKLRARSSSYEQKVLQFKLDKSEMDHSLSHANAQISNYYKYLSKKNDQIAHLNALINNQYNHGMSVIEEERGKLKELLNSHLLTDENWLNFKKSLQINYPNCYLNLKNDYPELTENNLRFVILIKLGLTNYELSNILGVSIDAVRKNKQRLKKRYENDYETLTKLLIDQDSSAIAP